MPGIVGMQKEHHQSHLWEVTGGAQESVPEKGSIDGIMRRTSREGPGPPLGFWRTLVKACNLSGLPFSQASKGESEKKS